MSKESIRIPGSGYLPKQGIKLLTYMIPVGHPVAPKEWCQKNQIMQYIRITSVDLP